MPPPTLSPRDRGPAAPPAGQSRNRGLGVRTAQTADSQTVSAPVDSASATTGVPRSGRPDADGSVDPMPSWMCGPIRRHPRPPVPAAPSPAPVAAPGGLPCRYRRWPAPSWGGGAARRSSVRRSPARDLGDGGGRSRPLLADPPTVDLPRPPTAAPADVVFFPTQKPEPDAAAESAGDETAGAPPPPMIRPSWTFLTEIYRHRAQPGTGAAITATVGGTPIPDAFPPAGHPSHPARRSRAARSRSPVSRRHRGAHRPARGGPRGSKTLLDEQIQPLGGVMGPGFPGLATHPPGALAPAVPEVPARRTGPPRRRPVLTGSDEWQSD